MPKRSDVRADAVRAEAAAAGLVEPVGAGGAERRAWHALDLASTVEGAFRVKLGPRALDARTRRRWLARLRGSYASSSRETDDLFGAPLWLLDGGRRVGTLRLAPRLGESPWVAIYSLYVEPRHRGRGVATRVLRFLAESCVRQGLAGIRLGTYWSWQRTLGYYLSRGFWVRSWKHDVQLVLEPRLPDRRIAIAEDVATLEVSVRGKLARALTATRDGDRLVVREASWLRRPARFDLRRVAVGTFALGLALSGWPLVRSEEHWARRSSWSDGGEFEGLAYKIGIFEQVAKEAGWVVATPRIPGLDAWQAWARGEDHGEREATVRAIETVLRERGLALEPAEEEELMALDVWHLDELLRRAVTATSLDEWSGRPDGPREE